MKRRDFLRQAASACTALAFSKVLTPFAEAATPTGWRTFEVSTHVEVLKPAGVTRIWVPAALIRNSPFQKTLVNAFRAPGGKARVSKHNPDSLGIISAVYPEHAKPVFTLTSRVSLKGYGVDLATPHNSPAPPPSELQYFLQPSKFVPTDGIVKKSADKATQGASTDLDKARAIYDWVVENTFRDPKVRGCGRGDIRSMLESGDLGGKCADLNSLYVGMARASGLPARHIYGLRIAKSEFGYKSLGLATNNATKSQHCRAEVYLRPYGWVPVDPADVRKVALEEPPGNLKLNDAKVTKARERLFGSWEMNWMAYNYAQDVVLPGSRGEPLVYFMYPQAETEKGRIDPLDPEDFKYEISVKET